MSDTRKPWQVRVDLSLAVAGQIDTASQAELDKALAVKADLEEKLVAAQTDKDWNASNFYSSLIVQVQARIVILQQVQADCTYWVGRVNNYALNQPYYDQHPDATPQKWYPMPVSMQDYLKGMVA